jgi:hypothetical protein
LNTKIVKEIKKKNPEQNEFVKHVTNGNRREASQIKKLCAKLRLVEASP